MSYDFGINIDTGGAEPHHIEPYFADQHPALGAGNVMVTEAGYARCGNYTSNVSGMWSKCLTAVLDKHPQFEDYIGEDRRQWIEKHGDDPWKDRPWPTDLALRDLADLPCRDLAPLLADAVEWGIEHIDELHEFDPSNGWGDADGAMTYLWDIQRMCEAHPNGTLYLSS